MILKHTRETVPLRLAYDFDASELLKNLEDIYLLGTFMKTCIHIDMHKMKEPFRDG